MRDGSGRWDVGAMKWWPGRSRLVSGNSECDGRGHARFAFQELKQPPTQGGGRWGDRQLQLLTSVAKDFGIPPSRPTIWLKSRAPAARFAP
jgi:hypothetical protein